MNTMLASYRDNCLARTLIGLLITVVIIALFGCVILVGVMLPVSDEFRIFFFVFGFVGVVLLSIAGVVLWAARLMRRRAAVMDEAFRVAAFLEVHPGWQKETERRISPQEGGDGFYFAHLRKSA